MPAPHSPILSKIATIHLSALSTTASDVSSQRTVWPYLDSCSKIGLTRCLGKISFNSREQTTSVTTSGLLGQRRTSLATFSSYSILDLVSVLPNYLNYGFLGC